jgi:hypothetical protein
VVLVVLVFAVVEVDAELVVLADIEVDVEVVVLVVLVGRVIVEVDVEVVILVMLIFVVVGAEVRVTLVAVIVRGELDVVVSVDADMLECDGGREK